MKAGLCYKKDQKRHLLAMTVLNALTVNKTGAVGKQIKLFSASKKALARMAPLKMTTWL
jgi:hypothetical protein